MDEVLYAWVESGEVGSVWAPGKRTVGDCVSEIRDKLENGYWPIKFDQGTWFPLGLLPALMSSGAEAALLGRSSTYHSFCPVYDRHDEMIAVLLKRTPTEIERRQQRG